MLKAHFDDSQFESKRADGRKLLKWNAVPTIFAHKAPGKVPARKAPMARNPVSVVEEVGQVNLALQDHTYSATTSQRTLAVLPEGK